MSTQTFSFSLVLSLSLVGVFFSFAGLDQEGVIEVREMLDYYTPVFSSDSFSSNLSSRVDVGWLLVPEKKDYVLSICLRTKEKTFWRYFFGMNYALNWLYSDSPPAGLYVWLSTFVGKKNWQSKENCIISQKALEVSRKKLLYNHSSFFAFQNNPDGDLYFRGKNRDKLGYRFYTKENKMWPDEHNFTYPTKKTEELVILLGWNFENYKNN